MKQNIKVKALLDMSEDCWVQYSSACAACLQLDPDEQLHVLHTAFVNLLCDLAKGARLRGLRLLPEDVKDIVLAIRTL